MASPGTFTAGQVLAAAEMNALPAGIVAKTSRTTSFNLTTSFQDVLSLTFTADSSRLYLMMAYTLPDNINTAGWEEGAIDVDGTVIQAGQVAYTSTTLDIGNVTIFQYYQYASSGSSTVKLRGRVGGGASTGRFYADAIVPTTLFVIDIGEA